MYYSKSRKRSVMFNASETKQMKPSQYLLRRSKSKMKKQVFLVSKICLATLHVLDILGSKSVLGYQNRREKGQKCPHLPQVFSCGSFQTANSCCCLRVSLFIYCGMQGAQAAGLVTCRRKGGKALPCKRYQTSLGYLYL